MTERPYVGTKQCSIVKEQRHYNTKHLGCQAHAHIAQKPWPRDP